MRTVDPSAPWYRTYFLLSGTAYLASVLVAPLLVAFTSPGDNSPLHAIAWSLDAFCFADLVLTTFVRLPGEDGGGGGEDDGEGDNGGARGCGSAAGRPTWGQRLVAKGRNLMDESRHGGVDGEADGRLTWGQRLVAKRWELFVLVVGLVPFDAAARGALGPLHALSLVRCVRFWRVRRCLGEVAVQYVWLPHWCSVVSDYVIFVGCAGHTEACLFYYLARLRGFGANTWVGAFTCGKCLGTNTYYFQFQTRSCDEPLSPHHPVIAMSLVVWT